MSQRRVVVVGAGPGGHAAALAAAAAGASVTLVEADQPGGQCVHHTCIPNGLMLSAAVPFLDAQELQLAGVFDLGDELRLGRAVARRHALVRRLSAAVRASLAAAEVEVLSGMATFTAPNRLKVAGVELDGELDADAVVIATGSRWEPERIDGVPDAKVVTLDVVTTLERAPASALVITGGPAATAFSVEAAFVLAAAGTSVTIGASTSNLIAALDVDVDLAARAALEAIGITINVNAAPPWPEHDLVVAPDTRRPHTEGLGLEAAGLADVAVDDRCRTAADDVYAAGDVTGGARLSHVAAAQGRVAGTNAAGGDARMQRRPFPHVLHTSPGIGWIGHTEASAIADGYDIAIGTVDLSWAARSITLGGRDGLLKIVADRELGQVLGVHVVGPEASEIMAVAALAIQAELTIDDLAASVHWHPSAAESLAAAARDATLRR